MASLPTAEQLVAERPAGPWCLLAEVGARDGEPIGEPYMPVSALDG